jgi:hypothetical protein
MKCTVMYTDLDAVSAVRVGLLNIWWGYRPPLGQCAGDIPSLAICDLQFSPPYNPSSHKPDFRESEFISTSRTSSQPDRHPVNLGVPSALRIEEKRRPGIALPSRWPLSQLSNPTFSLRSIIVCLLYTFPRLLPSTLRIHPRRFQFLISLSHG